MIVPSIVEQLEQIQAVIGVEDDEIIIDLLEKLIDEVIDEEEGVDVGDQTWS